jgi:hypothetical protein
MQITWMYNHEQIVINNIHQYEDCMSVEKKNPPKRGQALNDATSGQMGEEPRAEPTPKPLTDSQNADLMESDSRRKTGRKMSREI